MRPGLQALMLAGVLGFSGCGSAPYVWVHELPRSDASKPARTVIGPGDLVEVQVYGDEQTSTRARVLGDGTLTMPLLGPVHVVGSKPEELASSLEQRLTRYIKVPEVTVIIQESVVSVAVIGEVRQSGVLELLAPATVLEALAKAGGMTEFADSSSIFVLRRHEQSTQRIRFTYASLVEAQPAATRFHLKTGDVVVVE